MLLEQIVDLTKRIHKRNDEKLTRQGRSNEISSPESRKLRKTALGLRNKVKQQEDKIAAIKKQQDS